MFGVKSADNLYFATQAKTLKESLDGELEEFVKRHTDARLIIIDTLQKVWEVGGENVELYKVTWYTVNIVVNDKWSFDK